jgi:phytoene synthase
LFRTGAVNLVRAAAMRHTARMPTSLAETVRRHDPDRFFCALLAPAAMRETLFTLYAFNHELARALEAASEPGLALIRLHWWREVVQGADRRHEVATPLRAALSDGALPAEDLLAMIDMREAEIEPAGTMQALCDRQMQGPGSLAVAAGRALGAEARLLPRLRMLGAGYGVAGTLRNALSRRGRTELPGDHQALASAGLTLLGEAAPLPASCMAAALPAVLARRDLRRLPGFVQQRGLADRLAVLWAACRRMA